MMAPIAWADSDILEKLEIVGNEKTTRETIVHLSGLEEGQEITRAILEEARLLVASSGIFEYVKLYNQTGSSLHERIIRLEVKEKLTWFGLPVFSYSQTGFSVGGVVGEANLFGRLKKGAVFGDWGPDARRLAVGYRDPGVWGSMMTLSLDAIMRREDVSEYEERSKFRKVRISEWGGTFLPGVKWTPQVTTSLGLYYRRVSQRERVVVSRLRDPVDNEGKDIAVIAEVLFQMSKNYDGLFEGTDIRLSSQFSDDRYFSDYDYLRQQIYLAQGFTFLNKRANFVTKASIQLGKTLPYYLELSSGGAQNLRGYLEKQFRGDTKYAFNQEAMLPLYDFKRVLFRTNIFWDSTIIYFKDLKDADGNAFKRNKWHNGIGLGLRAYLKGVAIPLVGFDFARGLEDGAFSYYLNAGISY